MTLPLSRAAEAYAFAFCATLKHGQDAHMLAAQTGFLAGAQFVLESAEVKALVSALERIVLKVPERVSREEAADMAIEFKQGASEALQHFRALAGGESK